MTYDNSTLDEVFSISSVISALEDEGCSVKKYSLIKKRGTARSRQSYKLTCFDGKEYLLSISSRGVQNFYFQRSIKQIKNFSSIMPEFNYAMPIFQGVTNGRNYMACEYLRNSRHTKDNYPVRAISAFYQRTSVKVNVCREILDDSLRQFLSSWPTEYHGGIQRLEEYNEYRLLLEKEKNLTLGWEHGDYTTNNILKVRKGYFLVDFEFARSNQPIFFDLYDYLRSLKKKNNVLENIPNVRLHECKYRLIKEINNIIDNQNKFVSIFSNLDHPKLSKSWDELQSRENGTYNTSRGWCKAWSKNFISGEMKLCIFTTWSSDSLTTLIPLYREGKVLKVIGVNPDLYDEFAVLCSNVEHSRYFADFLAANNFIFVGKYVGICDEFTQKFISFSHRMGITVDTEIIDTRPKTSLVDFAAPKKIKSDIKRLKNRIFAKLGDNPVLVLSVEHSSHELESFVDMHTKRWKGGALAKNSNLKVFINELAKEQLVQLSALRVGETTVAYHLAHRNHNKSITSWMPAYDPDLVELSPGKVLLYDMILELRKSGYEELDFGRGGESYKYWFCTGDTILINLVALPRLSIVHKLLDVAHRINNKFFYR